MIAARRLLLSLPLLTACTMDGKKGATTPPTSAQDDASEGAATQAAVVDVDDAPPMPLGKWREVTDEGKKIVQISGLDDRIAACRTFVDKHGDHPAAQPVLEALADALVEKGGFDPKELEKTLARRAELADDDARLPVELVRKYHVKHGLSPQSGVALLELSRKRIAQDFAELELEKDERRKKRGAVGLRYQQADTFIMQGRMLLEQGKPDEALKMLAKAEREADGFAKDLLAVDAEGRQVRTLSAGLMDKLDVLTGVAHHKKGNKDSAKAALQRSLGFVDDLRLRELYDETRSELGLRSGGELAVKAEPMPAQSFTLDGLDGKKVKLADLKGKVVLVTFWATWCGPCKKELPELVKFQREHEKEGVVVLAVSTDSFKDRSKVKPFLESNGLESLKIAFEEPEQLSSYNYGAIPALYVIDRKGRVAHARTGYDPDLKEKLAGEILALVKSDGKSDGRPLLTIEQAPAGWGVLWQTEVSGDVQAVAIASPVRGEPGQVGVVGRSGLTRFAATGETLGTEPLSGWTRSLHTADLDADGSREWIVGGYQNLKVLDAQGKPYWEHAYNSQTEVVGIDDLNGDKFLEIVLQEHDRAVVMKAVPKPMWTTRPFAELERVRIAPGGHVLVQAEGRLTELDARGRIVAAEHEVPEGRYVAGRIETADGTLDLFGGQWDSEPVLGHDLDADGRDDVVVPGRRGVIAYGGAGDPILRVRSQDLGIVVGVGDLDGKPGEEIAIHVEHYGVVVLGKK